MVGSVAEKRSPVNEARKFAFSFALSLFHVLLALTYRLPYTRQYFVSHPLCVFPVARKLSLEQPVFLSRSRKDPNSHDGHREQRPVRS